MASWVKSLIYLLPAHGFAKSGSAKRPSTPIIVYWLIWNRPPFDKTLQSLTTASIATTSIFSWSKQHQETLRIRRLLQCWQRAGASTIEPPIQNISLHRNKNKYSHCIEYFLFRWKYCHQFWTRRPPPWPRCHLLSYLSLSYLSLSAYGLCWWSAHSAMQSPKLIPTYIFWEIFNQFWDTIELKWRRNHISSSYVTQERRKTIPTFKGRLYAFLLIFQHRGKLLRQERA